MDLPIGFRFAGHYCGVKRNPNKRDLALAVSDRPASAVGVFTTNRVCAAPVQVCRALLPSESVRAVVVNSGNANACTGEGGLADAREMCARVAEALGVGPEQVLVCSTGVIGRRLPMEKIREGIDAIAGRARADRESFQEAAEGILTTDTRTKIAARTVETASGTIRVAGFAKGAAMIAPNMATMLAFVLTDAAASPEELAPLLRFAVDESFHAISVEGHQSTNDSVLLLANGAGGSPIAGDRDAFARALRDVCVELAVAIVDDAEEATHRMTIDVVGARTVEEARRVARTVADSPLVKTAIFGNDPNWGRICSAAGYSGVEFEEKDLSLRVNGTLLYDRGAPTNFDGAAESAKMKASREVVIELLFDLGEARTRFWSCDLTTGYVRFNAEYTT
jgi:glutamate N-acetyltransferase/amino-acid N-acetyltransferase